MPHPFDDAIALTPLGEHRFQGHTHPAYANMVGPFGGITCAVLLQAVVQHPACLGQPVALTVNYAGPIPDGPFVVEATPSRTNRSTQHWTLALRTPEGDVATTGTAVTAERRGAWSAVEAAPPEVPPPSDLAPVDPTHLPTWVRAYRMHFALGLMDWSVAQAEQPSSETRVWLQDEPPRPLDVLALASMADAFFPRVFLRRGRFAPAGTVSITTHFHVQAQALQALGSVPVLGVARGHTFQHGFHDQSAQLWSAQGQLLATSHQLVYFKDSP